MDITTLDKANNIQYEINEVANILDNLNINKELELRGSKKSYIVRDSNLLEDIYKVLSVYHLDKLKEFKEL